MEGRERERERENKKIPHIIYEAFSLWTVFCGVCDAYQSRASLKKNYTSCPPPPPPPLPCPRYPPPPHPPPLRIYSQKFRTLSSEVGRLIRIEIFRPDRSGSVQPDIIINIHPGTLLIFCFSRNEIKDSICCDNSLVVVFTGQPLRVYRL